MTERKPILRELFEIDRQMSVIVSGLCVEIDKLKEKIDSNNDLIIKLMMDLDKKTYPPIYNPQRNVSIEETPKPSSTVVKKPALKRSKSIV